MQITTKLDRTRINHEQPGDVHLMVTLDAPEVTEDKRKPIDVMLTIDTSGSMGSPATGEKDSATKMTLARDSTRRFSEQLTSRDRVGIVAFATEVERVVPLDFVTTRHRQRCIEELARLHATGDTNLVGGAVNGLHDIAQATDQGTGRMQRVILFTDGCPTTGVTGHDNVLRALGGAPRGSSSISTFGYGSGTDYDPELLAAIAKRSGGNFYHAEGEDGILTAFGAELGSLRSFAATDVRVRIRPGKQVTIPEVLNDCTVKTEGDGSVVIDVGHCYGGEPQHVLAALQLPMYDKAFPRDVLVAGIEVTGIDVITGNHFTEQRDATVQFVKPADADQQPDPNVEDQRLRLLAGRAIEEAYAAARDRDHRRAARAIDVVLVVVQECDTMFARKLVKELTAIRNDVSNPQRFAEQAGNIHAASVGVKDGRHTGSSYTDNDYTSMVQGRTIVGMQSTGPTPVVTNGSQHGIPVTDPADSPSGPPSGMAQAVRPTTATGTSSRSPDKRRSSKW